MALTKKQIKQLRAMANSLKPLFYVGKNDLTESAVNQADETIEKHELIKCAVQDGSGLTAKEAAAELAEQLNAGFGIEDVKACYAAKYQGPIVKYAEAMDEGGFIDSNALAGKDTMEVAVFGNEERMLLVSRFDNLGKGASGAAVQCINLMLGADECTGLVL